jgi:hypothetical protein
VIYVEIADPPTEFEDLVATPGQNALWELVGDPRAAVRSGPKRTAVARTISQIPSNALPDYWTRALPHLCIAYRRICSYLGLLILPGTAVPEVDHFKPKHKYQHLAYSWENFRLSCKLANTFKGAHEDVVDPFEIEADYFGINLFSGHVIALSGDVGLRPRLEHTIARLHLNIESTFVQLRLRYIDDYFNGDISFGMLQRDAPFVAREIERQGKKIK